MVDELLLRIRVRPRADDNVLSKSASMDESQSNSNGEADCTPGPDAWKAWAGEQTPVETHFMIMPTRVDNAIKKLRENIADYLKVAKDRFQVLYRGQTLDDEDTVDGVGLENNSTVHVMHVSGAQPTDFKTPAPPVDNERISRLVLALQVALVYPRFNRCSWAQILRGDKVDNIVAATPGLAEDRTAIALMSDPLLLFAASGLEACKVLWKKHHCLIEALELLCGSMHGDPHNSVLGAAGSRDESGLDLDSLDDDEDFQSALMEDEDEDEEEEDAEDGSGAATASATAAGASGGDGRAAAGEDDSALPSSSSGGGGSSAGAGTGARPRSSRGRPSPQQQQQQQRGQRRRRPRSQSDSRSSGSSSSRQQRTQAPTSSSTSSSSSSLSRQFVTSAQLAAALRRIASEGSPSPQHRRVPLPTQPLVTREMFRAAIDQATANQGGASAAAAPTTSPSPSPAEPPPPPPPAEPAAPRVTAEREGQIRTLEELGFFNAAENLQALEATHGDIAAAVELILSMREN
ncbi:unnamed protein product [Notodromas monacha]|uniref:Ubiquitin-like protein 7 n=1 Tax=Notodromas monacha TaxID=399045 RepID=A0A7R9BX54_9CRUS|nr:unnamed protein product [Notodromas monacha]CAG0922241.1 unnamed protein product [Notodromas monacha]